MKLPDELDSDWSRWKTGEWIGTGEGAAGIAQHLFKVEIGLGAQFLLCRYVSKITEMSEDHINYMKNKMHFSDADIKKIHNSAFEELGIETILADLNEIDVHVFDSWRTILHGTGTWDGHKEVIHFNGENISGVRVIERISQNQMFITQEWNMPDGSIMTETGELKRAGSE